MSELEDRIRALSPEQRRRLRQHLEARKNRAAVVMTRIPRDGPDYPLSFAQERLWFLDQLAPGNAFYNLSLAQRLTFTMMPQAVERALLALAERHESLRTVFTTIDGEPRQTILESVPLDFSTVDLEPYADAQREEQLKQLAQEFAEAPFDLTTAPLFRARLVHISAFESVFLFVIHHIVADAWSLEVLFRDLAALYADAIAGRAPSLPVLDLQYVDYSVWQREQFEHGVLNDQIAFWRDALDELPTLDLPTDRARPTFQQFRGSQRELAIDAVTVNALRRLAMETNTTLFMVMLAAFYVLLYRYSRQEDLVVGTPIANRNHTEMEEVVGFFANTLVLRGDLSANPSFRTLLGRVRTMFVEAFNHQDLPFSRLVAALRPEQDLSRNPLFQVSFQLVSSARVGGTPGSTDWANALVLDRSTTIFDLTLNLWDTGADIRGIVEYNRDLFEPATVNALIEHYLNLLDGINLNADEPVDRLPILSDEERRRLLITFNDTRTDWSADVCLHMLFEKQAARTPDAPALRRGSQIMSYEELARRVDGLASRLLAIGQRSQRHIGLLAEPGFDMVTGVLAILKSGNAYVPLDPTAPGERLVGMVEDASIELVAATRSLAHLVTQNGIRTVILDAEPLADQPVDPGYAIRSKPDDVAYVLFTSGSTGRPKGVLVSHRSVVNYLRWCEHTYPVHQGAGAPFISPLASDMSITSLFLPLITGKTVHFLEGDNIIEALESALRDSPTFSFVKLTPSHLAALHNLSQGNRRVTGTLALVVGGEALRGEDLQPWRDADPDLPIFNEYGPTEATVGCCVYRLPAGPVEAGPVAIGRPIANTQLYVLDANGQPVGAGVPGELYIGGEGVALGYVSASDATAARFVPDAISGRSGERLYRTGDLVRHGPDGMLWFLGRLDRQIKIRGYRIEPGEIEAAICQHGAVAEAVALASEHGWHDWRLLVFVVVSGQQASDRLLVELRRFLETKLPAYMLPARIIPVEAIPLTSNGKVNARALLALDAAARATALAPDSIRPRTALEEVIARVFSDVLKVDATGVHDHFFAHLGGDSLLATRAVARLREFLNSDLPLRTLFDAPTVEALAQALQTDTATAERLEMTATVVLEVLDISDDQVTEELAADRFDQDHEEH